MITTTIRTLDPTEKAAAGLELALAVKARVARPLFDVLAERVLETSHRLGRAIARARAAGALLDETSDGVAFSRGRAERAREAFRLYLEAWSRRTAAADARKRTAARGVLDAIAGDDDLGGMATSLHDPEIARQLDRIPLAPSFAEAVSRAEGELVRLRRARGRSPRTWSDAELRAVRALERRWDRWVAALGAALEADALEGHGETHVVAELLRPVGR